MQPSQQYDSVSMLLSTGEGMGVDLSDGSVGPMYIYSDTELLTSGGVVVCHDGSFMPVRGLGISFE